jgi:4-amino-4-deoxy-L-arabinose transferase-like glycosyltransferase
LRERALAPLLLFLVACLFVFPGLGDRSLWQDEAETALIASNVLHTGLPGAWDGRLLVTQDNGNELTDSFLWAWTPWAMHYVAAAGMGVFGENSFGARWLFALLGCLSFPLFYSFVRRATGDRLLSVLTVVLMLTSVQYLLLLRQCRYYALLPLLFAVCLSGYAALPAKRGVALFSLGLAAMFHGNPVACAIAASGFLLHAALVRRSEPIWKPLLASALILGSASVPWILGTGLLQRAPAGAASDADLLGTLVMSNRYVCPWLLLAGLGLGLWRKRSPGGAIYGLCACLLAPMFVFVPALLWPNPRYVSFLLPIGALLAAGAIREAWSVRPWLGAALLAVVAGTNLLVLPLPDSADPGIGLLKSELGGYVYELSHPIRGPDEELVAWVEANTAADDLIAMTNDWLPVMFHTRRRVAGVISPEVLSRPGWDRLPPYLSDATRARWLFLRAGQRLGAQELAGALQRVGVRVERTIHLDIDDVRWINRPMVSKHVFRLRDGPRSGIDVLQLARAP